VWTAVRRIVEKEKQWPFEPRPPIGHSLSGSEADVSPGQWQGDQRGVDFNPTQ